MKDFKTEDVVSIDELIENLKLNGLEYNYELIEKAFSFAAKKHEGQTRLSGKDILVHLLTVANYIGNLKLDTTSVCAAILHDVLEKSDCTLDELDEVFGTEIAFIVEGLSKIRDYAKKFNTTNHQEEFTNLIFNSSEDIRIIIIRLAEKLHNLLSSDGLDKERAENSAKKSLYMYAPLAEYLGLGLIQRLLEDNAFKIIRPEEYEEIENAKQEFFRSNKDIINDFQEEIKELLAEYGITEYEVQAREKGVYSAYKKLKNKYKYREKGIEMSLAIEKYLKDIFASRIIVSDIEKCYLVLGLIQSNYETLNDEFVDYIANPKENGYKSIHTLFKFQGTVLEVQIRTFEMHEFNEFGPASHIAYKLNKSDESYTWTKDLVHWKDKGELRREDFKVKVFQNSVFCFTPKGRVITLPLDASPIDFAFKIHTDVGERYKGALVNGKMVSMEYKLKTGDIVEIIGNKDVNVTRDWLKFAKSTSTRARIRKILRIKNKI